MSKSSSFVAGSTIDQYTLLEFIGKGASAEVWSVKDAQDNMYAMKIFSPENGMSIDAINFFKKEFMRTKELNHPNVLSGIHFGEFNRRPYIIFDLCKKSLSDDYKSINYTERKVAEVMSDVSGALIYLHGEKLIHHDIKPDNILILENLRGRERFVLTDFGVSTSLKRTIQAETQTLEKAKRGLSPDYAAPEQLQGKSMFESDVFSLAVSLFELCEGETPTKSTGVGLGDALLKGGHVPDLSENYSNRLNNIIKLCLHKDPKKRPTPAQLRYSADTFLNEGYWPELPKLKPQYFKYLKFIWIPLAILLGLWGLTKIDFNRDKSKFDDLVTNLRYKEAIALAKENNEDEFYATLLPKLEEIHKIMKEGKRYGEYAIFMDHEGKWGIIKNGIEISIEAKYDEIKYNSDNLFVVKSGNKCGYLDGNGQELYGGIQFENCEIFDSREAADQKLQLN